MTPREARLQQLIALIHEARRAADAENLPQDDLQDALAPSRRGLWRADAIFGGQMGTQV